MLARATDPVLPRSARTAASCRRSCSTRSSSDIIDAALVSYLEGDGSTLEGDARRRPHQEDIIASAGSRYTYSANTMAYDDAIESGAERSRWSA